MNKRLTALWLALLTGFSFLWGGIGVYAVSSDTVADATALHDGILGFMLRSSGADSVERYMETALCENAGVTSEFTAIALSQEGYDHFAPYERALRAYLDTHEVYSATSREKYALALIAAGSTDSRIDLLCDDVIGKQGVMSYIFGLHVLNNGYRCGDYSAEGVLNTLVGMQLSDGGWAVMGSASDVDVTAMALQAMAPYYGVYSDVTDSIDRALSYLSTSQEPDGAYKSMNVKNAESTAQVLLALSSLGIEQNTDRRFIKNGHTVLEGLMQFQNADGSMGHTAGSYDQNATIQAYYAVVGYRRMLSGQGAFYILDRRDPSSLRTPAESDDDRGEDPVVTPSDDAPRTMTETTASGEVIEYVEVIGEDGKPRWVKKSAETASPTTASTVAPKKHPAETTPQGTEPTSKLRGVQSASPGEAAGGTGPGYKLWAILGIFLLSGVVSLVFILLKKRNYKNFFIIGGVAVLGVVFILLTNFQTPDQHYAAGAGKGNPAGTVTITIRCDVITDEEMPYYLPADGVILPESEYVIEDGDTVLDVLSEAAAENHIVYENDGADSTAYIAGIAQLYEFEYGELSGWMYRVNGETPSVGCNSYVLHDGDRIEWLYTENIGKDLDTYN